MDKRVKHSSKGLSFIRILDHDYSKQLQIPQEFIPNFNGYVPRRFIIESERIVTNKCWRVEMEEDGDGQIYLRGGWHDFVESLSLEVGNFLIFEYEEQSIFHVKVYGRNGCEKTTLNDVKDSYDNLEKSSKFEVPGESEASKCDEKIFEKHHQQKRTRQLCAEKNKLGIYKKQLAVNNKYSRTATTSISKKSICFSITLHNQKKHQFSQLTIPMDVSLRKLLNKDKVMLQNADGTCWPVSVGHRRDGRGILCQGWKIFLKENEFAPGDTLNFEFISDDQIEVLATKPSQVDHHSEVAKSQNEANKHPIYQKQHVKGKIRTAKVSISKDIVCFSVTLHQQKKHQFTQLTIPKAVSVQKNLRRKEEVMLQDAKGIGWAVKVCHGRDGRVIFTRGWKDFMKGNEFAAGDTLNFEFISDNLIQVHAVKASQVDHHSEESNYENKASDKECEIREDDEPVNCSTIDDKAIEDSIATKGASSDLKSSTFSFTFNTSTGAYLDIPKAVAEGQNLMNKESVVFRDPEGKCWPIQVRTWWDGRMVLTKGWGEFWKGHAITEGDSLELEFVSDCLIQVMINRANPTLDPVIGVNNG